MSMVLCESQDLTNIADAIREKTNTTDTMAVLDMPNNILSIQGGGGSPDAVLYTEQTLTDEQKVQARTNIGAGTSNLELDENLTDSTKAAPANAVGNMKSDIIQNSIAHFMFDNTALKSHVDIEYILSLYESGVDLPDNYIIDMEQELFLVHLSDKTPTYNDLLKGIKLGISFNETDYIFLEALVEEQISEVAFQEGELLIILPSFIVVPYDNFQVTENIYLKKGIYSQTSGVLQINDYDFNTIKQESLPEHLQFGETKTTSNILTWDGNLSGHEYTESDFNGATAYTCKISDVAPTYEDFMKGFTITSTDGTNVENRIVEPNNTESVQINDKGYICIELISIIVVPEDDGNLSKGTYFLRMEQDGAALYVNSLQINNYNFETTTFKTIDEKYLPTSYGGSIVRYSLNLDEFSNYETNSYAYLYQYGSDTTMGSNRITKEQLASVIDSGKNIQLHLDASLEDVSQGLKLNYVFYPTLIATSFMSANYGIILILDATGEKTMSIYTAEYEPTTSTTE